jgi:hypothetical protein
MCSWGSSCAADRQKLVSRCRRRVTLEKLATSCWYIANCSSCRRWSPVPSTSKHVDKARGWQKAEPLQDPPWPCRRMYVFGGYIRHLGIFGLLRGVELRVLAPVPLHRLWRCSLCRCRTAYTPPIQSPPVAIPFRSFSTIPNTTSSGCV